MSRDMVELGLRRRGQPRQCKVTGCWNMRWTAGLCHKHWHEARRNGTLPGHATHAQPLFCHCADPGSRRTQRPSVNGECASCSRLILDFVHPAPASTIDWGLRNREVTEWEPTAATSAATNAPTPTTRTASTPIPA